MAKKNNFKVNCGDWHLGWGFGGHDKTGMLRMTEPPDKMGRATFEWKGHSQGRHGQKWNFGAFLRFVSAGENIEPDKQKGKAPVQQELLNGVLELLAKYEANQK